MRIYLIFNSFWGVINKFWQIIFEAFFCKFVFNFECVYTSKLPNTVPFTIAEIHHNGGLQMSYIGPPV